MPPEKGKSNTSCEEPGSTRDYPPPRTTEPQHLGNNNVPRASSKDCKTAFVPAEETETAAAETTTETTKATAVQNPLKNLDKNQRQKGELERNESVMSDSSAQEIFQASLTFEQHAQIPIPVGIDRHVSSGGTLYPTLASVSALDSNIDSNAVEENWKAAAKPKTKSSQAVACSVGRLKTNNNNNNSASIPRDEIQETYSSDACNDGDDVVMVPSVGLFMENNRSSPSAASRSSNSCAAAAPGVASLAWASSQATARYEDISGGEASASTMHPGSTLFATAASAYDDYGNNSDQYSHAAVRYQETTAEDDDLIALKRAAYGGYDMGSTATTVSFAHMSDQEAEATVVEYDVHPSETMMSGGVHAELIGHDFSTAVDETCQVASPPVASASADEEEVTPSDAYEVMESTTATTDEATEATVIESGPLVEKEATAEAWSSSLTEEASVLQGDTSDTATAGADLDSKPPAINNNTRSWGNTNEEAEVMGITDNVHPSDWVENEAQAELIGTESNFAVAIPSVSHQEPAGRNMEEMYFEQGVSGEQVEVVGITEVGENTAQAELVGMDPSSNCAIAVPSSFPQGSHDVSLNRAYSMDQAVADEEAEVVGITEELHPVRPNEAQAELIQAGSNCAVAVRSTSPRESVNTNMNGEYNIEHGEAAEVMGITEEIHPSESAEDAAQTEIIDVDSNCAVAVPSNGHRGMSDYMEQAVSDGQAQVVGITEDFHPAEFVGSEAQAELLGTDYPEVSERSTEPGYINHQASSGEQAEVVGITEVLHPAEVMEGATEAELVGGNSSCAIAVPSVARQNSSDRSFEAGYVEQATIVPHGESLGAPGLSIDAQVPSSEHNEVQATLVDDRDSIAPTPITTILQETYEDSANSSYPSKTPTPLATVLGEEGQNSAPSCLSAPAPGGIPAPSSISVEARAVSAPAMMSPTDPPAGVYAPDGQRIPLAPAVASVIAAAAESDVNDTHEFPPIPSPSGPTSTVSNTSGSSIRSSDTSGAQNRGGLQAISNNIVRSTSNVMELLFGERDANRRRVGFDMDSLSGSVLPRSLLPSSVIFSEATNSWVATVNTSQKALDCNNVEEGSKALRAFSVPSKKQAMCLAKAWAPPRMHPFQGNSNCFICEVKFAVFRRACHCRNCGVCVCSSCSVQWPSKMLPATYNIKRETVVNICKLCDWLCSAFRLALLQGDHDKAVALHSTGNINLTTPFANVKGELFYPVHCAVLGGDLKLLKWLVDEHCCPLRSIRISSGRQRDSSGSYTPILTSKGRSLLGIALENRNIGIVRYLVVEKRMLLSAEKDLNLATVVQNLDLVLRALPEEVLNEQTFGLPDDMPGTEVPCSMGRSISSEPSSSIVTGGPQFQDSTEQQSHITGIGGHAGDDDSESLNDACIICFSNSIDCVATPCGHQICCLVCSKHIQKCPVCSVECSFMRVFKP